MMREILFRGKREDNGEFIISDSIMQIERQNPRLWAKFDCWVKVIQETVGQFTGLCDKNGKKIFEGDILLKGFEKVLVKWNANQCRWGIYSNNYEICGFNESTQGYFEVIGNIYDNLEFLEI